MSFVPVLYHAESSFYSQRARLAFAEKGVAYKSRFVNLHASESHEPWFLRTVNAKGTVPVVEHEGMYITDSFDIVEYVDTLPSDKPKLCPEGDSQHAMRVSYFRDELNELDIPVITFGAAYHRESITTNSMMPRFLTQKKIEERIIASSEQKSKMEAADPGSTSGLRDFIDFRDKIRKKDIVLKRIEECDKLLGEVEDELRIRQSEYGFDGYWLCGKTFTIADIFLSCLLHRLTFAGLSERLFLSKRPLTTDYYQRVLRRASFRKECAYANSLFWSMFVPVARTGFKRALPGICIMCVAATGAFVYYRRKDIWTFSSDILENRIGPRLESIKNMIYPSRVEAEL